MFEAVAMTTLTLVTSPLGCVVMWIPVLGALVRTELCSVSSPVALGDITAILLMVPVSKCV